MRPESHHAIRCLFAWMSLAALPALGAEPTEDAQTLAGMFAALDARSKPGFCLSKDGPPYVDYLTRVCQSAVQNRLKSPEDCSREKVALQVKNDTAQCLAMSTAEFDATVVRGKEGRKAFVREMEARGIDGDALIQAEREKLP